jgi:hypothetical protein
MVHWPGYDDHDNAIDLVNRLLFGSVPAIYTHRCRSVLVLPNNILKPDFVICTPAQARQGKHPTPAETFVVIEISDERTLLEDRTKKNRMYAGAGIPIYWIVDLEYGSVEVYTDPIASPNADPSYYRTYTEYLPSADEPGDDVPLIIAGTQFGVIPVDAIFLRMPG